LNLTKKDIEQLKKHGLSIETVFRQLEYLSLGISFVDIVTPASVGNGIEVIAKENQQKLIAFYEERKNNLEIVKFIPASGAATRMFKFLFDFLEAYNPKKEVLNTYLKNGDKKDLSDFVNHMRDFAFLSVVRKKIREKYPDFKHGTKGMRTYLFVKTMLEERGLNYAKMPKGLIPFHKYKKYSTTAFEEHLYETAYYASVNDNAYLHFTFSEKHVSFFKDEYEAIKKRVSKKTKTAFHISYSFQKKDTDTITVNVDDTLFRDENGNLVFRPSGHGALMENLNDVDADIIFIKNIDNVAVEEYVEEIAYHKKVLAGKLLWIQEKAFSFLKEALKEDVSQEKINEMKSFLWNELNIKESPNDPSLIARILDRPIRVCGVVKNTGAPGGGPFWVKNENEKVSLQIVEMAQIDLGNPRLENMISEATHFNPVDIVCGVRDYKGEKYDLFKYTDPKAGIISQKHQDGKPIKALELPGLWNGAMADWNTAFVEVPLQTFSPVKIVNDLLNKEHRPNA